MGEGCSCFAGTPTRARSLDVTHSSDSYLKLTLRRKIRAKVLPHERCFGPCVSLLSRDSIACHTPALRNSLLNE